MQEEVSQEQSGSSATSTHVDLSGVEDDSSVSSYGASAASSATEQSSRVSRRSRRRSRSVESNENVSGSSYSVSQKRRARRSRRQPRRSDERRGVLRDALRLTLAKGLRKSVAQADRAVASAFFGIDWNRPGVISSGLQSIARRLAAAKAKCITSASSVGSDLESLFGSTSNLLAGVKELEESPIVNEELSDVQATISSIRAGVSRGTLLRHIKKLQRLLQSSPIVARALSGEHVSRAEAHADATALAAASSSLSAVSRAEKSSELAQLEAEHAAMESSLMEKY